MESQHLLSSLGVGNVLLYLLVLAAWLWGRAHSVLRLSRLCCGHALHDGSLTVVCGVVTLAWLESALPGHLPESLREGLTDLQGPRACGVFALFPVSDDALGALSVVSEGPVHSTLVSFSRSMMSLSVGSSCSLLLINFGSPASQLGSEEGKEDMFCRNLSPWWA